MWKKIVLGLVIVPLGFFAYALLGETLYAATNFSFTGMFPPDNPTHQGWIIYASSTIVFLVIIILGYCKIVRMRIAGVWAGFSLGVIIWVGWELVLTMLDYFNLLIEEERPYKWWEDVYTIASLILPFILVGSIHGKVKD